MTSYLTQSLSYTRVYLYLFLYLSIPTVMSTNNHATVCGCVHVRDIINPLLLLLLTWSNIICFFVYMQACWNHTAAVRLWYLQCVWTAVLIRSRDRWWPSPSSMDLQIDTLTHLITILTVLTTVTHSGFVADRSWSCFCTRQTFIMSINGMVMARVKMIVITPIWIVMARTRLALGASAQGYPHPN